MSAMDNKTDDNQIDIQKRFLYEKVMARKQSRNKTKDDVIQTVEKKKKELKEKISRNMEEYRDECTELNVSEWLELHGNEFYHNSKGKHNGIDYAKIKENDVIYISKFFDVLTWWKVNEMKYPELAVGASIVLGKPHIMPFRKGCSVVVRILTQNYERN
jgi:hypothetical protein